MNDKRIFFVLTLVIVVMIALEFASSDRSPTDTSSQQKQPFENNYMYRETWQSSGACRDEAHTYWMCPEFGNPSSVKKCTKEAPECKSGFASFVADEEGDKACIRTWYRWECQPEGFVPAWSADNEPKRIRQWRLEKQAANRQYLADMKENAKQTAFKNPCEIPMLDPATVKVTVNVYEGSGSKQTPWSDGNRHNEITLVKEPSSKPYVLELRTYEPVLWNFSDNVVDGLKLVILKGYYPSRLKNLPERIPVITQFDRTDKVETCNLPEPALTVSGNNYQYSASEMVVPNF